VKRAVLLAVALLALAPAAACAKRVRVFAAGPKFDVAWVESREAFRAKMLALVDATKRGTGASAVQTGAGDAASRLLGPADRARPADTARDLIAFPEDVGLMAAFTGERGLGARSAVDLTTSILGLIATYSPVNAYYLAQFPELASRPFPPTRLLATALTDTFARVAVETFAELADTYDVWLEAGVNMAQDWRVVCVSKAAMPKLPGGVGCDVEDPARVALLRTPEELTRTYAYEATTPKPSNMALVFDPDGRLVSKQVKTYITPVELPGQLDLVPGAVSAGLSALRTPVGVLGFVTSKDAWMPDVLRRLDLGGVEILVQPEFFVNDTVRTTGPWAPDNIKGAGYSAVLRHPSIEAMVLPQLVGNVFDFSADSQQAIVVKPRSVRRPPLGAMVGQPASPGFAVVAPWVVGDPLAAEEPYAARRERLGKAGEALLPAGPACPDASKPGPCRNGQVEGVIFADVQVGEKRTYRRQRARRAVKPFTRSKPVAAADAVQRNVALAAYGASVIAAFEQDGKVLVTRSGDHGARWSRPVRMGRGTAAQELPSVAAGAGGNAWVAWQQDGSVLVSRSADGGRRWGAPAPADRSGKASQSKPSIAATTRGAAVLAWVDERTRFAAEDLPQATIRAARVAGARIQESRRLDAAGPVADLAATLDHAWAPSVAARGKRVLVSWIDFRTYDWDAYARESADGGESFGPERPVNDTPADAEALEDSPSSAVLLDGSSLVAYTDWIKDGSTARKPSRLYDTMVAPPGGKPRAVDGQRDAHTSTFSPALVALRAGGAVVAWQDNARGPGDIALARVGSRPLRVDDAGDAGWNAWRPAIAETSRRVIVAWEDERDGPRQIYVSRAAPGRIR
jgi:predicted amidohydrolase